MSIPYFVDQMFEKYSASTRFLELGEYEACTFKNCDLGSQDLSFFIFTDCTFENCNLSLAKIHKTAFRKVHFNECKLQGLHFETANDFLFEVSFDFCSLNLSSFYQLSLKKGIFSNSQVHEVDFSEADLSQSKFINCDLMSAIFDQCNLEKADFSEAYNYSIDPRNNKIKQAIFSKEGLRGLVDAFGIKIV
jgi:fluoroquinolone resistance protein